MHSNYLRGSDIHIYIFLTALFIVCWWVRRQWLIMSENVWLMNGRNQFTQCSIGSRSCVPGISTFHFPVILWTVAFGASQWGGVRQGRRGRASVKANPIKYAYCVAYKTHSVEQCVHTHLAFGYFHTWSDSQTNTDATNFLAFHARSFASSSSLTLLFCFILEPWASYSIWIADFFASLLEMVI